MVQGNWEGFGTFQNCWYIQQQRSIVKTFHIVVAAILIVDGVVAASLTLNNATFVLPACRVQNIFNLIHFKV